MTTAAACLEEALNKPVLLREAVADVAASGRTISVKVYEIEEAPRSLGTFIPEVVPLLPLHGSVETQIWPRIKRPYPAHQRAPKRARPDDDGAGGNKDNAQSEGDDDADENEPGEPEEDCEDNPFDEFERLMDELGEALIHAAEDVDGAQAHPHDPPPPPPAAPAPVLDAEVGEPAEPLPGRGRGRARQRAGVSVSFGRGRIVYYCTPQARFEAVCGNPLHGRCVLTRSSNAKPGGSDVAPRGGRLCGFLAAWLSKSGDVATKAEHWSHAVMASSYDERLAARAAIAAAEGGADLLANERGAFPGEGDEPPTLDGYLL